MRPKAYSYIRFSTSEQMKGDSVKRQTELSEAYAKEHNLELDTSLTIKDLGFSAYKGDHIEKGAFGVFLKAIENDKIQPGSYLLIENFDRFSRQKTQTALALFMSILNKGIIIVTLNDGRKFDNETLDAFGLITSLLSMERAHEESVRKGQLIKNAWDNKKANIRKKKLTKWSPKWLNLSTDRTAFNVNESRVKIVQDIFEWASRGLGTTLIIQKLETNNVSPWTSGSGIKSDKRMAKRWHSSYIQRVLTGREVLGEYKLRNSDNDDYETIYDYYPRIIDEDLFYQVQQARLERSVKGKGGGRKGPLLSNLFSKLAKCGYSLDDNLAGHRCDGFDENMVYVNKGKNSKIKYLQCSRIKQGTIGCTHCRKMYRYDFFETAFLTHIKDIDVSTILQTQDSLEESIQLLHDKNKSFAGRILAINKNISKLKNALDNYDDIPDFIIEKGKELETEKKETLLEIERIKLEIASLEHKKNQSNQTKSRLSLLISSMKDSDNSKVLDLRIQLSELFKTVIKDIEVYANGRVYDEKYYSKIEESQGLETANLIRESRKVMDKKPTPFFVVNYKSGKSRVISHDSKDPTDLIISTLSENNKVIESQFRSLPMIAKKEES